MKTSFDINSIRVILYNENNRDSLTAASIIYMWNNTLHFAKADIKSGVNIGIYEHKSSELLLLGDVLSEYDLHYLCTEDEEHRPNIISFETTYFIFEQVWDLVFPNKIKPDFLTLLSEKYRGHILQLEEYVLHLDISLGKQLKDNIEIFDKSLKEIVTELDPKLVLLSDYLSNNFETSYHHYLDKNNNFLFSAASNTNFFTTRIAEELWLNNNQYVDFVYVYQILPRTINYYILTAEQNIVNKLSELLDVKFIEQQKYFFAFFTKKTDNNLLLPLKTKNILNYDQIIYNLISSFDVQIHSNILKPHNKKILQISKNLVIDLLNDAKFYQYLVKKFGEFLIEIDSIEFLFSE